MKPVSRRRLEEALERVREAAPGAGRAASAGARSGAGARVAVSTARGGTRLVERDSILYLQAQGTTRALNVFIAGGFEPMMESIVAWYAERGR